MSALAGRAFAIYALWRACVGRPFRGRPRPLRIFYKMSVQVRVDGRDVTREVMESFALRDA